MTEEEIHVLQKQEEIGDKVKAFLSSPVGAHIDSVSLEAVNEAKDKLFELDPYQFKDLVSLQNVIASIQRDALVASSLRRYLEETVVQGNQATHQLDQEEA